MSYARIAILFLLFTISFQLSAHDFAKPEDAVNAYIQGVKTGSGKHIKSAYQATAEIQFFDQNNTFHQYTRDEFIKLVDTGNQWSADIQITNLLRTKNAAAATVEFTWGEQKQHGYVDYLALIYDGKRWQITSKVAQYIARGK